MLADLGPAHLLERALVLVAGPWETLDQVRWIATTRILAEAWCPPRLAHCREMLAEGRRAPPIRVVGHRLGTRTLYGVTDGNHRTIAAREAGKRVKAVIDGVYQSRPDLHVIIDQRLWRREGQRLMMVASAPEALVPYLLEIGVSRGEP